MTPEEMNHLRVAKDLIENPGLAAKLSHIVGAPIEKAFEMVPPKWRETVAKGVHEAIEAGLKAAVRTMNREPSRSPSNRLHKFLVGATGAAGGAFGALALTIELPISTTIMLRSIVDIARSEGESVQTPEAQLACLQVLALGGLSEKDDAAETGYFDVRAAMTRAISDAVRHISEKGLIDRGAPAIARLIAAIATRFSITVSQKVAAQAVPIVGAIGGASINTVFISHFQRMAQGHFIIRRLERTYGEDAVKLAYATL